MHWHTAHCASVPFIMQDPVKFKGGPAFQMRVPAGESAPERIFPMVYADNVVSLIRLEQVNNKPEHRKAFKSNRF